jgi:hypothetical protein
LSTPATLLAKIDAALLQGLAAGINSRGQLKIADQKQTRVCISFRSQTLDLDGAEAGIEPSSLSLKIKENFEFENFSTSMCTLIGLFQWYDRPSLSDPKLTVATGRDRPILLKKSDFQLT